MSISTKTVQEFVAGAKKFLVALTAALGVLATALTDGKISSSEGVSILVAFLGAISVYFVSNSSNNSQG